MADAATIQQHLNTLVTEAGKSNKIIRVEEKSDGFSLSAGDWKIDVEPEELDEGWYKALQLGIARGLIQQVALDDNTLFELTADYDDNQQHIL